MTSELTEEDVHAYSAELDLLKREAEEGTSLWGTQRSLYVRRLQLMFKHLQNYPRSVGKNSLMWRVKEDLGGSWWAVRSQDGKTATPQEETELFMEYTAIMQLYTDESALRADVPMGRARYRAITADAINALRYLQGHLITQFRDSGQIPKLIEQVSNCQKNLQSQYKVLGERD